MASAAEQQQQQQQQQQQEQELAPKFYEAMADFKNMFPQMDDDVIEAVLKSNHGAIDSTVDQLLSMSTDNENEKIRSEIEENEIPKSDKTPKKVKIEIKRSIQKWRPPLLGPLPDSFLRISYQGSDVTENIDYNLIHDSCVLEDERIAMFLQNEEFMAELRWNEDFLSTLENDSKLQSKCETATDEDLFRERIRNMGKASRRKFAQLTKVFTRSRKRSGRQLLPPAASCNDLSEESSRPQT